MRFLLVALISLIATSGLAQSPINSFPPGMFANRNDPAVLNGLIFISEVVTSGSQATVNFSSIPATYSSLKIVYSAQNTGAGTSVVNMFLKINNDSTSSNYKTAGILESVNASPAATTVASTTNGGAIASINQGTGSDASVGEITLTGYALSSLNKNAFNLGAMWSSTIPSIVQNWGFAWSSTAVINQLTLSFTANSFTDGSIVTLYGIQ